MSDAYTRLEEKVLERDQVGASGIFYDLVRAGRPPPELLGKIVRIHAPYTHMPYHQRLGKMPGRDVRLYELKFEGKPPLPEVHWAEQEPLAIAGTFCAKARARVSGGR